MTKDDFHELLTLATNAAYEFAKNYVLDDLPNNFTYTVKLNSSCDNPLLTQFDTYPADDNKTVEYITAAEAVDLLCRKNKVPVWIDINVHAVHRKHTVLELLCAGRYTDDLNELYYQKRGSGPFGIKSSVLPPAYQKNGKKFSLKPKKSFFEWLFKS